MNAEPPGAVYFIGGGRADTRGVTPAVVGGKACNLVRLESLGLTVPPAFVLDTALCRGYLERGAAAADDLRELLDANMRRLENLTGRSFGGRRRPLLVSVRSGAALSMPGMLDTVLNVGLNDTTVHGLVRMTGNPRLAWDSYRRLLEDFSTTVRGEDGAVLARLAARHLETPLFTTLRDVDALTLRTLCRDSLELLGHHRGGGFPQDPMRQLVEAVLAVVRSWRAPKAVEYRRLNGIDDDAGTAVTVQAMVYGNGGGRSGAGVGFTRDPASGRNALYFDFLFNAQGEDVVAGRHALTDSTRLERVLPEVRARLDRVKDLLEAEFRDVQDFEFTVQDGELFLLQTRAAKRTPWAALQIAVDLVDEGLIDTHTALERLAGIDLDALERVRLADTGGTALATCTAAGIGVASGPIAFDTEQARALAETGRAAILVREDIATDDIAGMAVAAGVLTARGGRTSHAAVVARQLGRVSLVGCESLAIDASHRRCRIGTLVLEEGDELTLDGDTGRVFAGRAAVLHERPQAALERVARWRAGSA